MRHLPATVCDQNESSLSFILIGSHSVVPTPIHPTTMPPLQFPPILLTALILHTIQGTTTTHSSASTPSTCKDGIDAFCKCHADIASKHPALCQTIVEQCRKSFCRPLCLRMAWKPTINVRCDLAPEWKECRDFKYQVKHAAKAITAQFQAHVCSELELGCCGNDTKLLNWVENHVYADLYPRGHLPLDMCMTTKERHVHSHTAAHRILGTQSARVRDDKDPSSPTGASAPPATAPLPPPQNRRQLCELCERVVETTIDTHEESVCIPPHSSLKKVIPNSIHERCLFMADMIGNMKERLQQEFREEVCSCTGCCNGGCYYHTKENAPWLLDLVKDVSGKMDEL